jgi:hypothetical protein
MFVLGRLSTRTVDPGGKTAADTNWPIPFDTVMVQVKGATPVVVLLTRLFVLTADNTADVTFSEAVEVAWQEVQDGRKFPESVFENTVTVLVCMPSAVPVTFTENEQVPLAGKDKPANDTNFVSGVAVIVAPTGQLLVKPLGLAISSPAGNDIGEKSRKLMPDRVPVLVSVFGLVI